MVSPGSPGPCRQTLDEWEMHDRMIKGCILANLMPEAAAAAERWPLSIRIPHQSARRCIRAQMKEWRAAKTVLFRGLATVSADQELLQVKDELNRELTRA